MMPRQDYPRYHLRRIGPPATREETSSFMWYVSLTHSGVKLQISGNLLRNKFIRGGSSSSSVYTQVAGPSHHHHSGALALRLHG